MPAFPLLLVVPCIPLFACCSAHTPSYVPVKHLTDALQQLASSMQQGSCQVHQLLTDLPLQLDSHLATAKQLHLLAFPPGQSCAPLVAPWQGHHHTGGGSSSGWDGASSSAAPSIRSMRSTTSSGGGSSAVSAAHHHPLPLLRVPDVAEAQLALEDGVKHLGLDMHLLVEQANQNWTKLKHSRGELEVERSVMQLFYRRPEELPAIVARLQGEVDALKVAKELEDGRQSWA